MNKVVKMDSFLVDILQESDFDNFSIPQLRDKYLSYLDDGCPEEIRKYVYKQILRLIKLGLIDKVGEKNSQKAIYKKTVLFHTVAFEKKVNSISQKSPQKKVKNERRNIQLPLQDQLKAYQVDMMASIGESEEYIRLFEQFPELKEQLSEKYHLARDKSSKLLGQIKAIKTVLSLRETKCA